MAVTETAQMLQEAIKNSEMVRRTIWTSDMLNILSSNPECDTGRANMQKTCDPEAHSEYGLWNRWPRWGD